MSINHAIEALDRIEKENGDGTILAGELREVLVALDKEEHSNKYLHGRLCNHALSIESIEKRLGIIETQLFEQKKEHWEGKPVKDEKNTDYCNKHGYKCCGCVTGIEPEAWPYPQGTLEYLKKEHARACKERDAYREKLIEIEEKMEGCIAIPRDVAENFVLRHQYGDFTSELRKLFEAIKSALKGEIK